jgi:hypothetical protein
MPLDIFIDLFLYNQYCLQENWEIGKDYCLLRCDTLWSGIYVPAASILLMVFQKTVIFVVTVVRTAVLQEI